MEGPSQLEANVRHVCLCSPIPEDRQALRQAVDDARGSLEILDSIPELARRVSPAVGLIALALEALPADHAASFFFQFQKQPLWSDIPVLLFTNPDANHAEIYDRYSPSFHNLFLLKRPASGDTLPPLIRNLFSLRRRQFQLRQSIEESERSVARVKLLSEVAHQLLAAEDVQELITKVFQKIAAPLKLEVFLNYLYDSSAEKLILNAWAGFPEEDKTSVQTLTLDEALYRKAEEGNPAFMPGGDVFWRLGVKAFASFPMMAGGRLIGAVSFGRRSGPAFSAEDLALLRTISNQAAMAAARRGSEEALQRLNQQLEERVLERTSELQESNQQMEAFTYSVSHDLRAPLRSIHGFSQLLLEDFGAGLPEEAGEYIRRIIHSSERMDNLITDLLEFSRLSRSNLVFAPVNLDSAVDRVLFHFAQEASAKKGKIEVKKPLGRVMGHISTIEQILMNLVSNGLKFVRPDAPPLVEISTTESDGKLRLHVRDNGIGISQEHQKKVFGLFERLHGVNQYPGTGIGLAIVAKAAERMNGDFGLESQPGKGSDFWFELPKVEEKMNRKEKE
jgi:signal transduction histidine kinase